MRPPEGVLVAGLILRIRFALVWHRLTLVPGLELHLHAAASAEVRAFAQRLLSVGQMP